MLNKCSGCQLLVELFRVFIQCYHILYMSFDLFFLEQSPDLQSAVQNSSSIDRLSENQKLFKDSLRTCVLFSSKRLGLVKPQKQVMHLKMTKFVIPNGYVSEHPGNCIYRAQSCKMIHPS